MAGERAVDFRTIRSLQSSAARRRSLDSTLAPGVRVVAGQHDQKPAEEAAVEAATAVADRGNDGLPDLARDLMAKAVVMAEANAEQQAQQPASRAEHTQRLLEAAQLHAADADAQEESADVQLALMAAEMRVPSETLASALQHGQPLPAGTLPHTSPGRTHPASVAARLQQSPSGFASDSGSWEAASRADSNDSGWDSVGPLGGPQGSWEWFGSRSSVGSGGLPSNLRPVDDSVIAERRAHGYVSLATSDRPQSEGSRGVRASVDPNVRRSSTGFVGAMNVDANSAVAAAASNFRCTSEPGLPPPALPPTARRPSSGNAGAGSDAIRRASFGRAAGAHQAAANPQKSQLPSFEEAVSGEAGSS